MKRGQKLLALGVALLAAVNALRWWPSDHDAGRVEVAHAATGGFQADNFQLGMAAMSEEVESRFYRDPFRPRASLPSPVSKPAKAPEPPSKTPEQLAEEAARAELGQIKLVGVVFRGDKGQAYFVKGEQVYMVYAGDKVGERFRVETIHQDSVQLLDPVTQVSGQVPVSGK